MTIVEIGYLPPPWGGVSVHLARLRERLIEAGVSIEVIDLSGDGPQPSEGVRHGSWRTLAFPLLFKRRRLIHIHTIPPWALPMAVLLRLRHIVVLSLHNERFADDLLALQWPLRAIVRWCYSRLSALIVDSPHCLPILDRMNLAAMPPVHVIPEFIPPRNLPPIEVPSVLELRSRVRFLIGSNAFRIMFHRGADLYGIDLIIEALSLLRSRDIDAGVVFLLPSIGDDDWFERLSQRIDELSLAKHFLFIHAGIEEASSLWKMCDLVVRATNTDGNSLTILESLTVGTPVIASDCVPRPAEARTFRTRDAEDLVRAIEATLAEESHRHGDPEPPKAIPDHFEDFLTFFRNTMETGEG